MSSKSSNKLEQGKPKRLPIDKWESNKKRRDLLLRHGWKPAIGVTILTRIAYWLSPDGCWTLIEAEAAKRVAAKGER